MKALRLGLCLSCIVHGTAVLAAAPAIPGVAEPLARGPFTYRTGEGQDIRVTVLARLTSPYAIAFLPNGDMLVHAAHRCAEAHPERLDAGTGGNWRTNIHRAPWCLPACMATWASRCIRASRRTATCTSRNTKPQQQGAPRSIAVARARYADGSLHDTKDVFVGEASADPPPSADTGRQAAGGHHEGGKAQDPTWLGGKVLRLNDDGSVPADNPFVGRKAGGGDLYAGASHGTGLFVHPVSGEVFEAEMGPNGGDEINVIRPGRNYGWPLVSLGRSYPGPCRRRPTSRCIAAMNCPSCTGRRRSR